MPPDPPRRRAITHISLTPLFFSNYYFAPLAHFLDETLYNVDNLYQASCEHKQKVNVNSASVHGEVNGCGYDGQQKDAISDVRG